jgi:hypothetical protein
MHILKYSLHFHVFIYLYELHRFETSQAFSLPGSRANKIAFVFLNPSSCYCRRCTRILVYYVLGDTATPRDIHNNCLINILNIDEPAAK